jgi:hypothetical protein
VASLDGMSSLRERASDTLLRVGTDNSLDRADLARALAAVPAGTPGHLGATGAVATAGWADAVMLWLSWRLRPRRITAAR